MSVYDELSLQDSEALSQVDDGADIVGMKLSDIPVFLPAHKFFLL